MTPSEEDGLNKQLIVDTLNREYGTSLSVEIVSLAIDAGFSMPWEELWLDSCRILAEEGKTVES